MLLGSARPSLAGIGVPWVLTGTHRCALMPRVQSRQRVNPFLAGVVLSSCVLDVIGEMCSCTFCQMLELRILTLAQGTPWLAYWTMIPRHIPSIVELVIHPYVKLRLTNMFRLCTAARNWGFASCTSTKWEQTCDLHTHSKPPDVDFESRKSHAHEAS